MAEKEMEAYCPYENKNCKCKPEGKIKYRFIGVQPDPKRGDYELWNCKPAEFTFDIGTINKYNKERGEDIKNGEKN